MFTLFIFVLIAVTLVLLSMFVDGLMEQYKEEKDLEKQMVRDGMEGYLDRTFGFGTVKVFKTLIDPDGNTRYLVYLPKYEWFKSAEYEWYEVFSTNNSFQHAKIER